ncbi:MAG: hypothetical protein ACOZAI_06620 [Pseudomonadota bacterium]
MKYLLNLYTDELRERPLPYGLPLLVATLLATAGLLLGYGLWTQHRLNGMEENQRQLQAKQETLKVSIASLEGQLVKQDQLDAVERGLARLRQGNAQREMLLAEMQGQVEHPFGGFSRPLHGLAAAHGQGVWLTRIQLTAELARRDLEGRTPQGLRPGMAEGSERRDQQRRQDERPLSMGVRLSGRMHQGQQLPRYMDALAEADAFRGLRFNSMQALRLDGDDKTIAFLISTRADDPLEQEEGQ